MRIDTGQHLRTDQRMKLAPRMIQSMEILQMPQQALEERIEQALTSNPTLEVREPGEDQAELAQEREQADRDSREGERELVVSTDETGDQAGSGDDFERLSNFSDELGQGWESNNYETGSYSGPPRVSRPTGERDAKMDALANTAARSLSLYDQLIEQWRMVETTPELHVAGEYLIGFIDEDGYIRVDDDTLRSQLPPGVRMEDVTAAWPLLQQTLEPPGMAAGDLRECLLLQMAALERQDADADFTLERELVEHYLKDIEANRLPKIAKALGVDVAKVKDALTNLRQFQPHPGRQLSVDTPRTITPDAVIEFDEENDSYTARLTHGRLPALHISRSYERMAKDKSVDKKTRDFIGSNLRSGHWLIDAIRQRHATLLRVIYVVLQAQQAYFEEGPQALKPLPMTTVADQLGIHVATVSRAVNEKYLQTPRGIVPLRMFFSGGTETDAGDSMSWAAVQARLEEMINAEDKTRPVSDETLAKQLSGQGIDLARRTVAKYRKQLNIPSARQRKEY